MTDTSIPPDEDETTDTFGEIVDRFEVVDPDSPGTDGLILYVMDLEQLVHWFALLYSYEWYDEEGEKHLSINDPIWTVHDDKGNYLPAAEKLQQTWNRVMHPDD